MKNLCRSRIVQGLVLAAVMLACAILIHPFAALAPLVPVIFGMALPEAINSDLIRQMAAWGILDPAGGKIIRTIAKTANYQILDPFTLTGTGGDASGTVFTTRGAGGAVTFTLPVITARLAGVFYDFLGVANQTFTVAGAAGTVVTFNNAAAASVAASTAGGKIGAHMRAICDGTSWHVIGDTVGVAYTVA